MNSIAVFTTTRAELGMLAPLVSELQKSRDIEILFFVGGTHLAEEHGNTINEIKALGLTIDRTIDFYLNSNDSASLLRSLGIMSFELEKIFSNNNFDAVCILGDRFELLPIVQAAILYKKPIIHLYGGEATEGSIDEQIRHMISKAAHLHFVSCNEYAENIRRMGEQARRIHNTGLLSIDSIVKVPKIPKENIFNELGLTTGKPVVVLTYHPVTLEFKISQEDQINNVFQALEPFNFQMVITAPNMEIDREKIMRIIHNGVRQNPNYRYVDSLGFKRYHSLIPHSQFVIGNSSSGISEVPFFKIPTINIGDRQKGRLRHKSVINTDYSVESIRAGIEKALSEDFRSSLKNMEYKFGDGHTAGRMVEIIRKTVIDQDFLRKKLVFSE